MDPTETSNTTSGHDKPRSGGEASEAQARTQQPMQRRFEGTDQLPRVVFHSLSSAMCAVVPVPFLDDHLVKLTRRRMTRELAATRGVALAGEDLAVLSGTESKPWGLGCFVGLFVSLAFKVVVKIVRRVFRTILFWLLVKDAADAASKTFHEGYLLDGMLRRAQPVDGGESSARAMRIQVEAVLDQIDTGALTGGFRMALRGTRSALSGGARRLSHLVGLRREADGGEQRLEDEISDTIPASWVERTTAMLQREGDYLHRLDELLAEQVYRARQARGARPFESRQSAMQEKTRSSSSDDPPPDTIAT